MAGGFFYTLGYITAKIENLGNAANFKSPTNNFSKNLLEGSNLARKEFEQSKKNKVSIQNTPEKAIATGVSAALAKSITVV